MSRADKLFVGILGVLTIGALAAVIVGAAYLRDRTDTKASDWVNVSVGVVLFLTLEAVLWYAWEARKQAEASGAAVEEMRTERMAQQDDPLLRVDVTKQEPDPMGMPRVLTFEVQNCGRRDASNVICWLEAGGWDVSKPEPFTLAGYGRRKSLLFKRLASKGASQGTGPTLEFNYEVLPAERWRLSVQLALDGLGRVIVGDYLKPPWKLKP